jgi:hypothetical protein
MEQVKIALLGGPIQRANSKAFINHDFSARWRLNLSWLIDKPVSPAYLHPASTHPR